VAFEPLMTLYLTDNTPPDEIACAQAAGVVALKLYPAGATTNSDAGVTDVRKTYKVLEAMQRAGLPLLVHGEVTDPEIDLFDREAVFIERVLSPLRRDLPELKIVFEHITTREAAQYVQQADANLAATITAHHLLYNRNAIFQGGIRPHYYCLPVLKREHRQAWCRRPPAAAPSSSWAPTAPRTPRSSRSTPAAAPAATPRTPRWSCTPGLRRRWRAGQAGGFCQPPRPRLLRPAAQHGHRDAQARKLDAARQLPLRRRGAQAAGRGRGAGVAADG
jgi:hypothetical protein